MKTPVIFLFVSFSMVIFSLVPLECLAYEASTTHPNLTVLTVDFFNKHFPSKALSSLEKQLLVVGATQEDNGIRSLNHFYDPLHEETWQFLKLQTVLPVVTAKEWAQNPFAQAVYSAKYIAGINPIIKSPVFSEANYTWQRAIYEYIKGNKEMAFKSLGHVLHLIQDLTVPEHTRQNVHLPVFNSTSYYEKFTATQNPDLYKIIDNKLSSLSPVAESTLDDYFYKLAYYTNTYFFSPDTIISSQYSLPEAAFTNVPEIGADGVLSFYVLGHDERGELFHLAKEEVAWRMQSGFSRYTLKDELVLQDYWERLGPKSITTGAGVIDLFFKEVAKISNKEQFLKSQESSLIASMFGGLNDYLGSIFQTQNDYELIEKITTTTTINPLLVATTQSTVKPTTTKTPATTKTSTTTKYVATTKQVTTTKSLTTTKSSTTTKPKPTTTKSPTTTKPKITPTTTIPVSFCPYNYQQVALKNSVIFNEIAWMGTTLSANNEWIELKNISLDLVNLSGWQIIDQDEQIQFVFPEGTLLAPGQFLLLERKEEAVPNITADFIYSGSLNNDSERLKLYGADCRLFDEVLAEGGWPAGDNSTKRTLERKLDLSWQTSALILGTPRLENSSGYVSSATGGNNPLATTTTTLPSEETTTTTAPLQDTTPTTLPPEVVGVNNLLINEIQVAGLAEEDKVLTNNEFIELYNSSTLDINLTGYYLQKLSLSETGDWQYASLVTSPSLEGKTIPAYGYFVIGHVSSSMADTYNAVWSDNYYLRNEGNEALVLKNPAGQIIDQIGWGTADACGNNCAPNPSPGYSIQRKYINDRPIDTDAGEDFEVLLCPSPGKQNNSCEVQPPSPTLPAASYVRNFSWHPWTQDSSQVVIEFDVDSYPFIPETETTNNLYTGLMLFLNQETTEKIPGNFVDLVSGGRWELGPETPGLIVNYYDCTGSSPNIAGILFSLGDTCKGGSAYRGMCVAPTSISTDGHFVFNVVGTTNGRNPSTFTKDDFITLGFYGYLRPEVTGLVSYLSLVGYDDTKYYFNPDIFYTPPTAISDFTAVFADGSNASIVTAADLTEKTITFSWTPSVDSDVGESISYEFGYSVKFPNDSFEDNFITRRDYAEAWITFQPEEYVYDLANNKISATIPISRLYLPTLPPNGLSNLPPSNEMTIYLAGWAKDSRGLRSNHSNLQALIFQAPPPASAPE